MVSFSAEWCKPCKENLPVLQEINKDGYKIYSVDIDEDEELAALFHVRGVPTFIVMDDGEIQEQHIGSISKEGLIEMFN